MTQNHKEVTIEGFVTQLMAQGYDQVSATEEATRLYVSTYGENGPAPVVKEPAPAAVKPAKAAKQAKSED